MRLIALFLLLLGVGTAPASARVNEFEIAQKTTENQIRRLIEPVLEKYCHEECKLMSVTSTVDLAAADEIAPGFDEPSPNSNTLAPVSSRIKILINDRVGPVSRTKLLELIQQFLDTLDYPVKIDTQIVHFPEPAGSEGSVTELREKIAKQFKNTLNDLLQQFCPKQCMVADFNIQANAVNAEEAQFGSSGEYLQEGRTAVRVKEISATLLMDSNLPEEERANILEMAKLKTNYLKNVSLSGKTIKFPRPATLGSDGYYDPLLAGTGRPGLTKDSKTNQTSNNQLESKSESRINASNKANSTENNKTINTTQENQNKQERYERYEKIERVENSEAIREELGKFKIFGLVFAASTLFLLLLMLVTSLRSHSKAPQGPTHLLFPGHPSQQQKPNSESPPLNAEDRASIVSKRYEIERLTEELATIFAKDPKVAKYVFSRIITEEGVEVTAQYIHIFGESIVMDMLRDPSLQSDLAELMEHYARNPIEMNDDERLDLLRRLHNRTISGKLAVLGNRSSNIFDFLAEMDGLQILELIRNESLTVKSIVLTQCDPQKRGIIYSQLEDDIRMKLLTELSRIDYLPRDFIFNVANSLKRKRREDPRLNTEALPGSEVLVSLLERTGPQMQRNVVKNLEMNNPDNARTIKSKLVSLDTLGYLRDGQLLEVILSLKHDELLQFLKGAPPNIRTAIFSKSPKELIAELEEELNHVSIMNRESYLAVERKILNRMKIMAHEGLINLIEVNERMFTESGEPIASYTRPSATASGVESDQTQTTGIRKVAGW